MTTPPRVLVIGAGIGGLTAANVLADHGVEVDLVERRPDARRPRGPPGLQGDRRAASRAAPASCTPRSRSRPITPASACTSPAARRPSARPARVSPTGWSRNTAAAAGCGRCGPHRGGFRPVRPPRQALRVRYLPRCRHQPGARGHAALARRGGQAVRRSPPGPGGLPAVRGQPRPETATTCGAPRSAAAHPCGPPCASRPPGRRPTSPSSTSTSSRSAGISSRPGATTAAACASSAGCRPRRSRTAPRASGWPGWTWNRARRATNGSTWSSWPAGMVPPAGLARAAAGLGLQPAATGFLPETGIPGRLCRRCGAGADDDPRRDCGCAPRRRPGAAASEP